MLKSSIQIKSGTLLQQQNMNKAMGASSSISMNTTGRQHESGEKLAEIKEQRLRGSRGRPGDILTHESHSASKPASPFIVRLQKQKARGSMQNKHEPSPQNVMMASKTTYGKSFTRQAPVVPALSTSKSNYNHEGERPTSSYLDSMRPSTAATSNLLLTARQQQQSKGRSSMPSSSLRKSESEPQFINATIPKDLRLEKARITQTQSKCTVPIGPRLRSADRASLRNFVSHEDLAKMDLKKKLAKMARLRNSATAKQSRPPALQTLERAKQRAPLFKPSDDSLQGGPKDDTSVMKESIYHHTASFSNYFSQKRTLASTYTPSIHFTQVLEDKSSILGGMQRSKKHGKAGDDVSELTSDRFDWQASVNRLHSHEGAAAKNSYRNCACERGLRRHTKIMKRFCFISTERAEKLNMRLKGVHSAANL